MPVPDADASGADIGTVAGLHDDDPFLWQTASRGYRLTCLL